MIFEATIKHYEEWDEKVVSSYMFVCADTMVEAVQQISNHYGEDTLEFIEVRPFSPDKFLAFTEEDAELFHTVRRHLESDVCW